MKNWTQLNNELNSLNAQWKNVAYRKDLFLVLDPESRSELMGSLSKRIDAVRAEMEKLSNPITAENLDSFFA